MGSILVSEMSSVLSLNISWTLTFCNSAETLLWVCWPVSSLGSVREPLLCCSSLSARGKTCKVVKTTSLLLLILDPDVPSLSLTPPCWALTDECLFPLLSIPFGDAALTNAGSCDTLFPSSLLGPPSFVSSSAGLSRSQSSSCSWESSGHCRPGGSL